MLTKSTAAPRRCQSLSVVAWQTLNLETRNPRTKHFPVELKLYTESISIVREGFDMIIQS